MKYKERSCPGGELPPSLPQARKIRISQGRSQEESQEEESQEEESQEEESSQRRKSVWRPPLVVRPSHRLLSAEQLTVNAMSKRFPKLTNQNVRARNVSVDISLPII